MLDAEPAPQDVATAEPVPTADGGRGWRWLRRGLWLAAGLLVFVVALELIKRGAALYGRQLIGLLRADTPVGTLGLGWLLAYVFLSGSPVAALAVSLFGAGALDGLSTFTMITGSRLGAALVILISGAIYAARDRRAGAALSVGVLALLTTAAIYLPALALGYWLLASGRLGPLAMGEVAPLRAAFDLLVDPIVNLLAAWLPAWVLLALGVGALLLAFALIDRSLPVLADGHWLLERADRLAGRPLAMLLLGAAVTTLTLSVSLSVGLLVPLVARGLLRRERTVPYIMGANITTFVDTLVAALIAGGPAAFTIVLVEMVSVALLSLLVLLLGYRPFAAALLWAESRISSGRGPMALFVALLAIIPLGLLLL